ncbi:rhomboid family intramembrane serine protease [uncultured Prevotella sp.]|uniref:rhomboid family intramembrane serine protease n=1 Tax=uncultured Prevotella sp. TaxID=159272 RepID=UPI0025894418|nr:rhomboid family intramembrane serine protease [uncultured Prevotella sp.]
MFRNIPIVTRNLLIINVLVYLLASVVELGGKSLTDWGALHFFMASDFHVYQFITYQFLHGGFTHLFFNMFALWMFGCVIENVWGPKKFIFYYIFCGIGAGLCQEMVQYISFAADGLTSLDPAQVLNVNGQRLMTVDQIMNLSSTIGASGAVYGILLAFGMTFPNERIFIFPLPIPIKAKWFVAIYAIIEFVSAMSSVGDGVAHMAHIGGMLFGFLLILYWRKRPNSYFNVDATRQFFDKWSRTSRTSHTGETSYTSSNTTYSRPEDDMEYNARKKARQEEIDKILDKIRVSGYDSLSKEEKRRLFEASHEK